MKQKSQAYILGKTFLKNVNRLDYYKTKYHKKGGMHMQIFKDAVKTCILLIFFTVISYLYFHLLNDVTNLATIYILCIFLIARFTSGYVWGILASIIGMLGVNYLFIHPRFAFDFTITGYPVTFLSMIIIAFVTTTLTTSLQEQIKIKVAQEFRLKKLNEMNKKLIMATNFSEIIQPILDYLITEGNISCIFYSNDPIEENIAPIGNYIKPQDESVFSSSYERAIAHLSYISLEPKGMYTKDQSHSKCYYLPIAGKGRTWGMFALLASENPNFIKENIEFFNLLIPQLILAFEHQLLSDDHQRLTVEAEKEKMRANLLRAVSHDLRTPLTSMIGSSAAYIENNNVLSNEEKIKLVSQINEDSTWLLNMVENLLSVTRIVTDTAKVTKTSELLEEVIGEAVVRVKKRYPDAPIKVSTPDDFVLVPLDATLIEQVIINLIENAIKHARTFTYVEVIAKTTPSHAIIEVADDGVGIAEDRIATLFDGYGLYTNQSPDSTKGMGIGLSICKTIVLAHDGTLTVRNLQKGSAFTITLPLEDKTQNKLKGDE